MNRSVTFVEIGCGDGGSLQMWKRFLGPHAQIVGLDSEPRCRAFEDDQIAVRIGAQQDPDFLHSVIEEFGSFDVVIDDGSHVMMHVEASFLQLYPRYGVYLVEDLHCAYRPEFGGGLHRPGSFIEVAKALIDELNADHARGALLPTQFTRTTHSVCFYDSVVVFERGFTTKKWAPRIGKKVDARANAGRTQRGWFGPDFLAENGAAAAIRGFILSFSPTYAQGDSTDAS